MMNIRALLKLILPLCLLGCSAAVTRTEHHTGYHFSSPDKTLILPDTLREVSGLTSLDSTTFACVQDENGILFIYDAHHNHIQSQFTFTLDGDYEGITRVGQTLYILRSDGVLFELINYRSAEFTLTTYDTGIPADNNEGLCYDAANHRLLIACKGKIARGPEHRDKRVIYGFDLHTKQLSEEPVFTFDLEVIRTWAQENQLDLPEKERKKKGEQSSEPWIRFRPSAICIHPLTGDLFLLSAVDHLLFIFDENGQLRHIEQLDPDLYNKAEGISFYENGDMLITNEGQDKKPTLLFLKYHHS